MKKKIEDDIVNIWKASGRIPSDKAFFDCLLQDPAFYDLPAWQKRITAWKEACKQEAEYKAARRNLAKTATYLKRAKKRRESKISFKRHSLFHEWKKLFDELLENRDDLYVIDGYIKELNRKYNLRINSYKRYSPKEIAGIVDSITAKKYRYEIKTVSQMRKDLIDSDNNLIVLDHRKRYD